MGWGNWFKDLGGFVKEKSVTTKSGGHEMHWLRDTGGSKKDHVHVVSKTDSKGKTSGHSVGNKSKR